MIGPIVAVTVDRPLGSGHPEHPDMYFPVNYGHVKGMTAADGAEEGAYILGVSEPVPEFTGRIIAVIKREDDIGHNWVVAPEGGVFTKKEIAELTAFQEQYFTSEIILLYKRF